MIPEAEIWGAALAMIGRYPADAMLEASARADQMLEDGDWQGAATWHHIRTRSSASRRNARRRANRSTEAEFHLSALS